MYLFLSKVLGISLGLSDAEKKFQKHTTRKAELVHSRYQGEPRIPVRRCALGNHAAGLDIQWPLMHSTKTVSRGHTLFLV